MLEINEVQQYRTDAQGLAERFLNDYASDHEVSYPINPFQILTSLGIGFVFRAFDGIEGLYFPKENTDDADLVVINSKRPITRQRFTAAYDVPAETGLSAPDCPADADGMARHLCAWHFAVHHQ